MADKILIVDDDAHILDVLGFALKNQGYEVIRASNGVEALALFQSENVSLVVLDIMMPELEGTEVCRQIRQDSNVPVIFLSSRDDEIDRILGLELGGDDFISKPFSPRELVARVRAVLRRANAVFGQSESNNKKSQDKEQQALLVCGQLSIRPDEYKVFWGDDEVLLTVTEYGLLRTLLRRPGKVYTREELIQLAYENNTVVSDRTVDSHLRRIRGKFKALNAVPIITVHGIGYKLSSCE